MTKRLLSLLLMLALLLFAAAGLGEQTPELSAARINALQKLAGENAAQWHEGTPPSPGMSALQLWQWTDWFLSDSVRSLLGTIQDVRQLDPEAPLSSQTESVYWQLLEMESILSRFETQLEDDRLAILNGISLCQSEKTTESGRLTAYNRILEAESEIQQISKTICGNYEAYLALVSDCSSKLESRNVGLTLEQYESSLAAEADRLEMLENAANADFVVSVISSHQFRIQVLDANMKSIKDAEVTVTNSQKKSKSKTLKTNAQGNADFWLSDMSADESGEMQLSVVVKAKGYRTREVQIVKLRGGETASFCMEKDDGTPYLIMGCFNGRDILSESNTYYCTSKNKVMHTFAVKLQCKKNGKLELRYPVDAKATKYETVEKTFKASDSGKTVFEFKNQWLSMLPPGAKVSFKITSDGHEYVYDTQIDIQKAIIEEPFFSDSPLFTFFSGHGGFTFDIADKVPIPFIGNSTLSLDIPGNYPQFMFLPSGLGMFAWGRDFMHEDLKWESQDSKDQARAIKEFEAKNKTDKLLSAAGAYRNVNTTTETKMLGSYGAHVTPFVAVQGLYRSSDHSLELKGNAGATLAFKGGFTQTFTMGPIPFFAGVDFSMGATFATDVILKMDLGISGGTLDHLKTLSIGYGTGFGISIRLELGGTIGMGIQDVASVALRGYGYINPVVKFTPNASATATLGMGIDATVRLLFLKWKSTLYSNQINLAEQSNMALSAPPAQSSQFDNTGAMPPQAPLTNSSSYGSSGVEPAETKQLFSQLDSATGDFQYVVIGGQTYLFWIQPGTESYQARLNWYNLNDLSSHGEVTWKESGTQARRRSFADYDFTVESSRGINNKPSNFCALTILSGSFSGKGSEEDAEIPEQSMMTTVLMQQNSQKGLDIVFYHEDTDNIVQRDSYPIMPEVFLSATSEIDSVYLVSTYINANRANRVNGIIYAHEHRGSAGINTIVPFSGCHVDSAGIARYHVGLPSASSSVTGGLNIYALNEKGDLSRLYYANSQPQRDVLAHGDIINFRVYTQLEGLDYKDHLFYLERARLEDDKYIHRLRSITRDLSGRTQKTVQKNYDVEVSTDRFDIVKFGTGVYLYWTECSTPTDSKNAEVKEEYLVRCVRYDPGMDAVCGPFSLVQLSESPNSIKLQDSGTGYYSVDLQNKTGSYLRQSFSRFTYKLVSAAEMTAAVPSNPNVCAGDYAEIVFSVKNTGNVPLSGLNVKVYNGKTEIQSIHIDCTNPDNNTNTFGARAMKGEYTVSRISGMYDPLNHDSWEISQTESNGTTTVRSVQTTMLMPGDTHCYKAKLLIPADWEGNKSLVAKISSVEGDAALRGEMKNGVLMLTGAPQAQSDPNAQSIMITRPDTGEQVLHTDVHDLAMSAQPFRLNGEDYVHISIMNLSGNTASDVTPVLTASYRGKILFSHQFVHHMGDDFGYSMDIPLKTLTGNRSLQELDLNVSTASNYEEFADSDNHVRLLLLTQLCIADQPQNIPASEGKEAVFSVTAAGGGKPYRYQWQRMTGADQWKDIPGANQDTYRIASVKSEQNGLTVRCVVTDQFGDSVTSDSAMLSILPQTGDRSQLTLWLLLAIMAAAVLMATCRRRSS